MAKLFKAKLNNKNVLVAMIKSDLSLTVYPFSNDESDMTVISNVKKQDYSINEESGMVELEADKTLTKDARRTLFINPIYLDETTRGKWD